MFFFPFLFSSFPHTEHEVVLVNQGILSPHDHSPSPSPYSPRQPPTSPYYEADPLALTPPLSSAANRLYPNLIEGGGDGGFYEGVGGATPIYQDFNGLGSRSSNINLTRVRDFWEFYFSFSFFFVEAQLFDENYNEI